MEASEPQVASEATVGTAGVDLRGEWLRNHWERVEESERTGAPYAELFALRMMHCEVDAVARVYRVRPWSDVTREAEVLPFGWLEARGASR